MVLVGCSDEYRTSGDIPTSHMKTVCLDGVEYWILSDVQGYGGWGYMSVRYNQDSTVVTCTINTTDLPNVK